MNLKCKTQSIGEKRKKLTDAKSVKDGFYLKIIGRLKDRFIMKMHLEVEYKPTYLNFHFN